MQWIRNSPWRRVPPTLFASRKRADDWQISRYIESDLTLVFAALGFVAVYLLIHTGSVWLTVLGVLNIVLSFPLAFFVFRDVLGNTQELPVLSIASVFVTIGIAVDDVFVFVDTFKQQGQFPNPVHLN